MVHLPNMSRSYKRNPITKDGYKTKWKQKAKREANKATRKRLSISNGKQYKKYYNSWNISDYSFRLPTDKKSLSK